MRVSLRGREELAGRVQQVETAEMSQTGCGALGRREDGLPLPGLRPSNYFSATSRKVIVSMPILPTTRSTKPRVAHRRDGCR